MSKSRMDTISESEWMALRLTKSYSPFSHAFAMLRHSELRVAELVELRHEDIDLQGDKLSVCDNKHSGNAREITLTFIRRYHICCAMRDSTSDTFVFSSRSGNKLDRHELRRALQKAAREARIERRLTLHMIRKT